MGGAYLAKGPCRRTEGQENNCRPHGPSELWLNQGGEPVQHSTDNHWTSNELVCTTTADT